MDDAWNQVVPGCTVEIVDGDEEMGTATTQRVLHPEITLAGKMVLISFQGTQTLTPYRLMSPPSGESGIWPAEYAIRYEVPASIGILGFAASADPCAIATLDGVAAYWAACAEFEKSVPVIFARPVP